MQFFFATLCLAFVATISAQTCTNLDQPDGIFWKSLRSISGFVNIDVDKIQPTVMKIAPYLPASANKCFGSVKLNNHLGDLIGVIGNRKCKAVINGMKNDDIKKFRGKIEALVAELKKATDAATVLALINGFLTYVKEITTDKYGMVCSLVMDNLLGCVEETIVPALVKIAGKTACCADLIAKDQDVLGSDLGDFLQTAIKKFSTVVCSKKASNQYCLNSFVQSYITSSPASGLNALGMVLKSVQVPNAEGCNAFNGKTFTNTVGASETIGFAQDANIGECYPGVNNMANWITTLPFVKTGMINEQTPVMNLYDSGKCVNAEVFYPFLDSKLPASIMAYVKQFTAGKCFHFSHGMDNACF